MARKLAHTMRYLELLSSMSSSFEPTFSWSGQAFFFPPPVPDMPGVVRPDDKGIMDMLRCRSQSEAAIGGLVPFLLPLATSQQSFFRTFYVA